MPKIAILRCKNASDPSCVGCSKCLKSIAEKSGTFSDYDEIDLIALTDCGGPLMRHYHE